MEHVEVRKQEIVKKIQIRNVAPMAHEKIRKPEIVIRNRVLVFNNKNMKIYL